MTVHTNGYRTTEPIETTTRAWEEDTRLARIEQRLKALPAEVLGSSEQRTTALRDAIATHVAEELAERDKDIRALITMVFELEAKFSEMTAVNKQVDEIVKRLDGRQAARDEGKRGKTGRQGERGPRGEKGAPGARGPAGKAAEAVVIVSWQIDREKYRASPLYSNGVVGPMLELRELFLQFLSDRGEW